MSAVLEEKRMVQPRVAPGRVRVVLVGCGAIAEQMHLPVLAGHEGVELVGLVDRDEGRARRLAEGYGVKVVAGDVGSIAEGSFDAAILATPPFHHGPGAIGLMRRGVHVLVEKPMALNLAEAEEMCRVAEEEGVRLAVGLYRRLLPVTRLLRRLVGPHPGPLPGGEGERLYGRARSFSYEWGGIGGYASATLGLMRKEYAGGGVLMDLGAHVFDQLVAVFGERRKREGDLESGRGAAHGVCLLHGGRVVSYSDDARGGIEADCVAELAFGVDGQEVRGVVELSRVRNLANRLVIRCEGAELSAALNERFEVTVKPEDGAPLVVRGEGGPDVAWFESYRAEIDDWLTAIGTGGEAELSGRSALASVGMIEECYRVRRPLCVPWLDEMAGGSGQLSEVRGRKSKVEGYPSLTLRVSGDGTRSVPATYGPACNGASRRRVLVTGAGGFIGSRVAEILSLRDGYDVRAMVRGAKSASRVARLAVELVQGDLKSDADVRRAVEGCDAVVHCAVGTAYGQPREIEAVTVGGTVRLAAAAREAGVRRLVHLSSIGVHDAGYDGVIDGDAPVRPARGDWYGRTKAAAEAAVWAEERRGLSVVVLRPGCVYGPFGFTFVINPLMALAEGRLVLEDAAESPANTVFVDNLVEAIACSLKAADEAVKGRAFAIGDGDECTWGEYYGWFAERMGAEVFVRSGTGANGTARRRGWLAGIKEAVLSAEAKGFAKRVLASDPLGTGPRWLLGRFPGIEARLREGAGMNSPVVYRRDGGGVRGEAIVVTARAGRISIAEATERLGYLPPVGREYAQQRTWEWALSARVF